MTDHIIEIQNLNFSYNRQSVLRDVNLSVDQGDFVAMIGPQRRWKDNSAKIDVGPAECGFRRCTDF